MSIRGEFIDCVIDYKYEDNNCWFKVKYSCYVNPVWEPISAFKGNTFYCLGKYLLLALQNDEIRITPVLSISDDEEEQEEEKEQTVIPPPSPTNFYMH